MAAVVFGVPVRDAGGLQFGVQLAVGTDEGVVAPAIEPAFVMPELLLFRPLLLLRPPLKVWPPVLVMAPDVLIVVVPVIVELLILPMVNDDWLIVVWMTPAPT